MSEDEAPPTSANVSSTSPNAIDQYEERVDGCPLLTSALGNRRRDEPLDQGGRKNDDRAEQQGDARSHRMTLNPEVRRLFARPLG